MILARPPHSRPYERATDPLVRPGVVAAVVGLVFALEVSPVWWVADPLFAGEWTEMVKARWVGTSRGRYWVEWPSASIAVG